MGILGALALLICRRTCKLSKKEDVMGIAVIVMYADYIMKRRKTFIYV